jgi:pectate lyase
LAKKRLSLAAGIVILAILLAVSYYVKEKPQTVEGETGFVLVYDHFDDQAAGIIPFGYSASETGGKVRTAVIPAPTNQSILLDASSEGADESLIRNFHNHSGILTAEVKFMQPAHGNAVILQLLQDNKPAISVEAESGSLIYRISKEKSETLLANYKEEIWYVIKVVSDASGGLADVYINESKVLSQVPFYQKVKGLNSLQASAESGTVFHLDDIVIAEGKLDVPLGFASRGMLPTGGLGGKVVTVDNYEDLYKYMNETEPYIIQIPGKIELRTSKDFSMYRMKSNKTIIGISDDAEISGGGLVVLHGVSNVIIRNIKFSGARDDSIAIMGGKNVWIDHNTFTDGYDGLLDVRDAASNITISWNKFYNHDKTSLVGHADGAIEDRGHLKVTYHHNWFSETVQRHPRVRYGEVHVMNNFYDGVQLYGIRASTESSLFVESNYFLNTKLPTEIHGEPKGKLVERNNIYDNSGKPQTNGKVFDPLTYYTYPVQDANEIVELIRQNAGSGTDLFK